MPVRVAVIAQIRVPPAHRTLAVTGNALAGGVGVRDDSPGAWARSSGACGERAGQLDVFGMLTRRCTARRGGDAYGFGCHDSYGHSRSHF